MQLIWMRGPMRVAAHMDEGPMRDAACMDEGT